VTRYDIQKDPSKYWSVKEVADYFGVCVESIYRACRKGEIAYVSVGRCIRIQGAEIMRIEVSGGLRDEEDVA
jgi:excisionase family DNA binding protein